MKYAGELKKTIPDRPKYPLSPEEIDGCRNRNLWSHRALGTAVAVLGLSDDEFREAMDDPDRRDMFLQIFRMVMIDIKYAEIQAKMRQMVLDRFTHWLVAVQYPYIDELFNSPLNLDLVPDAPGIRPEVVNGIRP